MSNNLLFAWAAGIIDGEGSIYITKVGKNSYSLVLRCGMTHAETIYRLKKIFGVGDTYNRVNTNGWKDEYIYQIAGDEAAGIIIQLQPFLCTKRRQADLAIEYYKTCKKEKGVGNNVPQNLIALREVIFEEMQLLNKRGKDGYHNL